MATILIVDDHVLNRQFLMVLLGYSGHQLIEATDGIEALDRTRERRPDLIIADILMPNMDGYQFVARLREDPVVGRTPVVFYTAAYHEREAGKMAAACGVRWVLPKPSEPELILQTVQEALGAPGTPDSPDTPGEPALAEAAFHAPQAAPLGVLDRQLSTYLAELETSSTLMSRMVDAGEDTDIEDLQQVVRRLSNALSSLQAVSLRLTALIDFGMELAGARDAGRVLDISCRVVQDICVARYAAIGLLDQDQGSLQHYVTRGMARGEDMRPPLADAGVLGMVLASRLPRRMAGLGGSPAALGLPPSHPPVHSLLVVPVATQDRVFGWLYLADKVGAEAFNEVDERAAATVASQLATVYENLQLYAEIQRQHRQLISEVNDRKQAQDALRRTLRARTVMAECNHVMVHATEEQRLLEDMCRTVVEAGGYRAAWIGYHTEDGRLQTRAWAGEAAQEDIGGHDAGTGDGSGRAWMVIDVPHPGAREQPPSSVTLPLRAGAQVFGVLKIREQANAFDDEQLAMLEELADDISFGVTSLRIKAAREKAERDLQATEDKLSGILASIDNMVWSVGEAGFIFLNPMVEKVFGRPAADFYRSRDLWFKGIHPQDRARVKAALDDLPRTGSCRHEYRVCRPDGAVRWIEERARAVTDDGGALLRIDGTAIDISERKDYEARIEHLASHDALTGLANRNLLGDRIAQALAQARRSGKLLGLLFLDLDRFKGINDSLGHEIGDALLLQVAARLREVVREGDTVARQGGDEFIILLAAIQRPEDVVAVANKIFEVFSVPFMVRGHELFISTSIGATLYPDDGDDMKALLRNADTAMYRAKEERGNSFQFYSREMSVRALERAELEIALRRALDRKEFELHYQPKVDGVSGRIIGAEALIRWRHPDRGLVSPTRFIPMAEELGLIVPIGDWVLRTACAQNKAWQNAGLPPISVAVNLSGRQFKQEDLVESIALVLAEIALEPRHLELELTESVVMSSAEQFISKLEALEDLGVQLSIDDFGTGYSSLSYLKRFPLHHLKIDQSFVRDIVTDHDDATITSSVISLGHSLNLKVIAEGVETEEQVAFLRDHHCDEMQGYFFSRPLPAGEFAQLLRMQ
ncbi:EAL domain-containing protein [Noviherbaspirillum aridicola]|uniref:PAS domain S-box-containing protein/diguanylate cyclase (GGDEF)-like protein n=1 Tax=Noviherbaspirillum aridicola TaxID=2849687 RepID=A0ABQ4Q5U9_9BURK|nr:EAL domain-containing protein [Noviherbaspirillum aridicola]GIZ52419.1 hypothetical protein NCCP691_24330 [Noviherbaspirillum aridicola]